MPRYIALANWTDQGIRAIKDSPKRADAARALADKMGCKMGDFYMTIGGYDMVVMFDAPDDETMAKLALTIASGGNIRTTTLKAIPEDAYRKVIAGM
jgi:uncharacterized protein with GYD domain